MKNLEGYDEGIILKIWDKETFTSHFVPLTETIERLAEYMGVAIVEEHQEVKIIKRKKSGK